MSAASGGWAEGVARSAYGWAVRLLLPLWFARLWWRGRREPAYRDDWAGRLGCGADEPAGRWWLHAVSLGETRAAAPLIDALRRRRPGLRLLLTHGTATGRAAALALLREGDRAAWLPLDTPGAVRRFLRRHRPAVGVVMETEVWPNLLAAAAAAGVPMVLANARLSPRSLARGRRAAVLLAPALARFDAVLAQTEGDAERLRIGGARAPAVTGNLKFDLEPAPAQRAEGRRWRAALARAVVLAAATRDGEEALLLREWAKRHGTGRATGATPGPKAGIEAAQRHGDTAAAAPGPDAAAGVATSAPAASTAASPRLPLLLLVPRHPQRFDEVARLAAAAGLRVRRRSGWGSAPTALDNDAEVWIGDSLGEMALYYALADVALLGGSFEPLGGQNLIEAAACGCPLLMGPHTFNFAQAAEDALAAGAALRVDDLAAALDAAAVLLRDDAAHAAMARAGTAFTAAHRGAAQRTADAVAARVAAAPLRAPARG